ncbi:hypothetical protein EKO27_g7089 [Xylaria grammica]|uniref:DUF1740-domain-containing protein n=1 Tax=Xylaria grammica TaxID=363999 RepID=A0A439D197_9PEZI|nr:hypothetical protein EKO27_g7089 [Xylaria grammica]
MSSSREKGRIRSTVPKFASFKPKPKPTDVIQYVAEGATNNSKHAEYYATQKSNPQPRRRLSLGIDAELNEPKLDESQSYYLDKRGDSLITRYESNDRSSIPSYRRVGDGRILGSVGFMKIEKVGSREEFFIRHYHEGSSFLSRGKKNLLVKGVQPIRIRRKEPDNDAFTKDYLSFNSPRKRKRDGSASEELSGHERRSYRSIHGDSKEHEYSDSDEEYDSDAPDNVSDEKMGDPIALRSIELSRKVRQCPEDLESWLELVDHQNSLLDFQSGTRVPTTAEIKSYADIKLTLLEQALTHINDDERREKLNFKAMVEGLKVWEFNVALKKFAESMRKYPKSFELWKLYINFLQTTLSACRYDEIRRLYTDKLQSLGKELRNLATSPEQIECSIRIIYVFLRLTRFLADAGFAELALSCWQASLELNLARPSTLSPLEREVPPSFKEYWESEIPRLGEDDWQGWATFVNDVAAQEPPNASAPEPLAPPTTRDGYKAWFAAERQKARNAAIPARTLDEGAEDDPFRVVMFTDLQNILLYFPTDIVRHIQSQILDAFLIFCRLPPILQDGDLIDEAARDPFLIRSVQDVPFDYLLPRNNPEGFEDQQNKSPEFFYEVQQMSLTPEVLFHSTHWFKYFEQVHKKVPFGSYRWVATTLKQLVQVLRISELGPYTLAFESLNKPGNEKKSAKALLKQDPLNVDLYLGYSNLEYERQNKAAARSVLSAALGLPSLLAHDRARLGTRAAWLELYDGDRVKAVLHLCQLIEGCPTSENAQIPEPTEQATPSRILKAKQFLVTNRDYKTSSGDIAQAVIYAEGLVLLEYLTQRSEKEPISHKQGDIWSAIVRITQYSKDLVSRGQQHGLSHERFLQSSAHLLYYHATHGPFRPGLLREQLAQYLSYFPSNTIFLSLFAWREERLSINDRVRSLLQGHVLTRANESLSSHVFAISYELRTGNAHSTRAAFERSLSSEVCMHHVGLWVAYIRFCHSRRELRVKSKEVFYRAIQACPWSKDVFMEAFGTLAREMDSAELKSVYATMCEKRLRIHVDMDEFVKNWRKEHKEARREKGSKSRKM